MPPSDQDLMKQAFAALLRGDTAERDRICQFLERRMDARERHPKAVMGKEPIVLVEQTDGTYAPKRVLS